MNIYCHQELPMFEAMRWWSENLWFLRPHWHFDCHYIYAKWLKENNNTVGLFSHNFLDEFHSVIESYLPVENVTHFTDDTFLLSFVMTYHNFIYSYYIGKNKEIDTNF